MFDHNLSPRLAQQLAASIPTPNTSFYLAWIKPMISKSGITQPQMIPRSSPETRTTTISAWFEAFHPRSFGLVGAIAQLKKLNKFYDRHIDSIQQFAKDPSIGVLTLY